ncbi:MAG: DUF4270 family protein [Bacteroidales bacterium]|nr:DUF4270 family protein [Bacteroidales bacterium]
MRNKILAILSAIILISVSSCSDDVLFLDSSFVKTNAMAEHTDVIPVQLSTFRLDSVLTSNQNVMWVGRAKKPIIGNICSESFIKVGQPQLIETREWAAKERYDSIEIVFRHTGKYEGDTMQNLTLNIKRLAQPIRFAKNESAFFNLRTFSDSSSIGRHTFKPRPHTLPRVHFRLDDEFGKELVKFVRENRVTSEATAMAFEKQLGGIKVTYEGDAKSLVAFRADSMKIILHSHISDVVNFKIQRVLPIIEPEKQYNRVWNEDMDEPYDNLVSRRRQVTEDEGGHHSVMFEGMGFYTRINFPSLETVVDKNYYAHIVKATLTLYAEIDSYDKYRVPPTFILRETNRYNVFGNAVINNARQIVPAIRHYNSIDRNDLYYTYDLTYYINSRLATEYIEPTDGLVLTWDGVENPVNYDFMVFNGHGVTGSREQYRSKLDIIYYFYDREER